MEYLRTVIQAFANVQWSDILDIVIVAFLFYKLLPMLCYNIVFAWPVHVMVHKVDKRVSEKK